MLLKQTTRESMDSGTSLDAWLGVTLEWLIVVAVVYRGKSRSRFVSTTIVRNSNGSKQPARTTIIDVFSRLLPVSPSQKATLNSKFPALRLTYEEFNRLFTLLSFSLSFILSLQLAGLVRDCDNWHIWGRRHRHSRANVCQVSSTGELREPLFLTTLSDPRETLN